MSNSLAIATITAALAQIIRSAAQEAVGGADVVFGRPENGGNGSPLRKVQLYLYQVTTNSALSNADLPTRGANGTLTSRPRVALDLHYLMSFYGNETELEPQRMLGAVVRDLHARPILTRQVILDAVAGNSFLAGSNLADAVERIRFTPAPLNLEELSKLWSIFFQTPHALSVAYQGNAVIVESDESPQPALPVLKRGPDDRGVDGVIGPFPSINGIWIGFPGNQGSGASLPSCPNAQPGAPLNISGANLDGDTVTVRFTRSDTQQANEIIVPPSQRSGTEIRMTLPAGADMQDKWAAGIYTLTVVVERPGSGRKMTTNSMSLPLSPLIVGITPQNPIMRGVDGSVTITVKCSPPVLPEQQALMLLGDREIKAQDHPALTDTVSFVISNAPVISDCCVYLRVDGINSVPIIVTGTPPMPSFDPDQKVTIT